MSTKTKIALAAALVAATSSLALAAQSGPNRANRHPPAARGTLHSAPVALPTGGRADPIEIDRNDSASSPFAGGVG